MKQEFISTRSSLQTWQRDHTREYTCGLLVPADNKKLLEAAVKYEMKTLQKICTRALETSLELVTEDDLILLDIILKQLVTRLQYSPVCTQMFAWKIIYFNFTTCVDQTGLGFNVIYKFLWPMHTCCFPLEIHLNR